MSALPSGTVALARHDHRVRDTITTHSGCGFSTTGDAFAAAFPRVADATGAAIAAQWALQVEQWEGAVALLDLGEHRLRDLDGTEHLCQHPSHPDGSQ